jgi:hypothetical protein
MQLLSKIVQPKKLPTQLLRQWSRHQRVVFLFVCLLVVLAGVWKGYQDVYVFRWTDQQKNDYREKSLRLVQFRENSFNQVIDMIRSKKDQFMTQTGDDRDIFGAGSVRSQ